MDNLARTYSSSVDLPEVYTSLTDTSTVVRKILQTTITVGLITNNVNMESKHELHLIAVDFQERWLDRCKCSLVQSSRFSWGKSFTQGGCSSVKRSIPLPSVVVSTLSLYFVIILITSSIQDTSRSIQLATAPNEALQEVFTVIGSVRQIFFSNFGIFIIFFITIGSVRQTFLPLGSFVFVFSDNWLDDALHQQTSLLLITSGPFHNSHLVGLHLLSELFS